MPEQNRTAGIPTSKAARAAVKLTTATLSSISDTQTSYVIKIDYSLSNTI